MKIIEEKTNDTVTFSLNGRLDSNTSATLEKRLENTIKDGVTRLIIDFEQLDYISSAGLRIILKTSKALDRADGKIIFCAMQDYVREVFEIAGFDTFLPIVATREEAAEKI
jgi:anti-sigma B factor antagonist